jgi:GMP synthase-like glutamine amidotransferase
MGGPMNVYEDRVYPWLLPEKKFIEQAIEHRKFVLGVCLGAQLAADVLGGPVTPNLHKEIGWFPVSLTEVGRRSPVFEGFPIRFDAFQWHGDTFSIPPGAEQLAESEACANQAFQYAGHVVGLQFHLDYSVESIEKMLRYCGHELVNERYIQTAEAIRTFYHQLSTTSSLLYRLLDNFQVRWNADQERRCARS